ncbi:hypothetical protein GobsT_28870 [Gemmata obscuriglobus]|uniref:Uncharacterized protein n=1 Tax=Gemmata obscuriglobus TaxID=114 RepID=A0A2Z3HB85_9BACT|nr:hypothetical protein [Gemmata obscuriglobus]AWM38884.1 hypothetical protein C1280_19105 [Gemmata obscuriglobus]QEG28113.1 hypothetical protein GobsT_28870 [Gemmata obscuriglobus]VTS05759.1 unnamed protein product [Gemmata obscuriglobus UQM 2246]
MAEAPPELRAEFDSLFVAPFATRRWASARGRSHWVELEGWQDAMAGPLSAIAEAGSCEYVYFRDDWYFATVNDPATLRARLLEWHAGLAAGVERFAPATPEEAADQEFMRAVVGRMRELVQRACALEEVRCHAKPGAAPETTGCFVTRRSSDDGGAGEL